MVRYGGILSDIGEVGADAATDCLASLGLAKSAIPVTRTVWILTLTRKEEL